MNKKKLQKYFSTILLSLTFYYSFTFLLLPNLIDPKINKFDNYQRLWNWDQKQHAQGDFDHDDQEDFVSFTGCLFLSSVNEKNIPDSQKCTAQGIFNNAEIKVGQKYISSSESDLNLSNIDKKINHSYISQKQNENWEILVNGNEGIKIFEIKSGEALKPTGSIPISYQIDELLYNISSLFFLLSIPLIPLTFIFSLALNTFGFSGNLFHIIGSLLLLSMSLISHFIFKNDL